jgi:hypothetical protein
MDVLRKGIEMSQLWPDDSQPARALGADCLNNIASTFSHLEFVQGVAVHPFGHFRIIASLEIAAFNVAEKVDQKVMVLSAPRLVGHDPLENDRDLTRNDLQAGFFMDFPTQSVFEPFSGLDGTTR